MVGLAIVVGVLGAGAVCGETKAPPPDKCPNGPDGKVTITFEMQGKDCVVAQQPVPDVCVDRGNHIRWTLVNKDCTFDENQTAVEMSQPQPTGNEKKFQYVGCTPKKNGWKKGGTESLSCRVPEDADKGHYKYSISGQIKPLDPDIEVRKGG